MMGRLEMKGGMGENSLFKICVDSVGVGGCESLFYTCTCMFMRCLENLHNRVYTHAEIRWSG